MDVPGTFSGIASVGITSPETRSSIENPSVSLQDVDAWDRMYGSGSKSDAGVKVSPESSLSIASVWQAVNMISGDVARLPLDVYKRNENGREVDRLHPAQRIVRRQWNDEVTAFKGWRTMMVHALIWGNGYAYIDRNGRGEVKGLYTLLPDRTAPVRDKAGQLFWQTESRRIDGQPHLYSFGNWEILHVAGMSIDGTTGAKLVESARQAWGLALARQGFESKFFKHGVRSGGVLELPLGTGEKFQNNVTEGFRKHHEGEQNWFKTVILRDGVKFHQTSFNAQESQLNESSERSAREVARYFNMSPSRLGVEGSSSYNSKQEDNQNHLDTTLSPWLTEVTSECDSKLLSDQQTRADTHYFEHNTNALLRMDPLKRSQKYAIDIRNGIISPNEARRAENMPEREGGDEYVPLVKTPTSPGGADKGENNKPRGPEKDDAEIDADTDTDDEKDDEESERQIKVCRLVFNMTNQCRNKAGKGPAAFGEWLAGSLRSHRKESMESLGDEQIVDEFVAKLREMETVPVRELRSRVEEMTTQFEKDYS